MPFVASVLTTAYISAVNRAPTEPEPSHDDPVVETVDRYERLLFDERGASLNTVEAYLSTVRTFLGDRFDSRPADLGSLGLHDVNGFIRHSCQTHRPSAMPSRRHKAAMLSSPRRPDTTIRIFSSAVYCLRVLRRISRTVLSAGSFLLIDFCLIFVPFGHYDEPEILRYAITSIRPKGADVRHGELGFLASMSGKGNCYDNAVVETFFKTIKSELIWRTVFMSRSQAETAIAGYIDGFYNPVRRHSTLDFTSPVKFEAEAMQTV